MGNSPLNVLSSVAKGSWGIQRKMFVFVLAVYVVLCNLILMHERAEIELVPCDT